MEDLHKLVEMFRKRIDGLREAANDCSIEADRFALQVRADEAERCVTEIKKRIILTTEQES